METVERKPVPGLSESGISPVDCRIPNSEVQRTHVREAEKNAARTSLTARVDIFETFEDRDFNRVRLAKLRPVLRIF